jgi:hypothetical protein
VVRITVYRTYSAEDSVALAAEPELLVARIRSDRQRRPSAVLECRDAALAAAVVDVLSQAFGVVIRDIDPEPEPLEPSHHLLDQGRALLKHAKRLNRSNVAE